MGENISERKEELISLEEIERIYKEKEEKEIPPGVEEIEIPIIDIEYVGTGQLVNLYTINNVYVSPVNEKVVEILRIIDEGKIPVVKVRKLKNKKRIMDIREIREGEKKDVVVPKSNLIVGFLEKVKSGYRIVGEDGDKYYVFDGTENTKYLERIHSVGWNHRIIILGSIIERRRGTGGGEVKVVQGLWVISPRIDDEVDVEKVNLNDVEEKVEKKEEEKIKTDVF
ncbi:MAG: hypothetical protein QW607_01890 [Desulfurococcaceae archaeon]